MRQGKNDIKKKNKEQLNIDFLKKIEIQKMKKND